jgi:hypothetical protein
VRDEAAGGIAIAQRVQQKSKAARALGRPLILLDPKNEVDAAFTTLVQRDASGLVVVRDPTADAS